jgi:hypothetical protein
MILMDRRKGLGVKGLAASPKSQPDPRRWFSEHIAND